MNEKIPGTNMTYGNGNDAFSVFRPMIEVTGGLSLSQICSITGLQPSTIQNWVKRDYIPRPENKKYFERHLARILLISALRECMNIEDIDVLMTTINGDTQDESDDIISDSKLYDYFCNSIKNLSSMTLDDKQIEDSIIQTLENEDDDIKAKLVCALKVMIYAYISGICQKEVNENLKLLQNL